MRSGAWVVPFILSFLPRVWLQEALFEQWTRTLSYGDCVRVRYWGATGNPDHHHFAWADELPHDPL